MKAIRYLKTYVCVFISLLFIFSIGCDTGEVHDGDLPPDYTANITGHITVSYPMHLATDEESKLSLNNFARSFMLKYDQATVSIDFSDYSNKEVRIASGDIGDVYFMGEEETYTNAITHSAIMPLDAYLEILGIDVSNVYSGIYNLGLADAKLYMVPRDHNHIILYYNVNALDEQGLNTPQDDWTWEEFKGYCKKLTKENDDGTYSQIGAAWHVTWGPNLIPFLEGWGGKWFDSVNKKVSFVSDENVLKGFSELINAIEDGLVFPQAASGNWTRKYTRLEQDDCVFLVGVYPSIYSVGQQYAAKGVKWNIANWPQFPVHRVGTGATGFGVYNRTKRPDTAAAFVLYLFTDEGQRAYHDQIGGSVPLTKNLAQEDFWRIPYPKEEINYDAFISFPEADTVGKFQCRLPDSVASIITSRIDNVISAHFSGTRDYVDSLTELERLATEKWETLYESESS